MRRIFNIIVALTIALIAYTTTSCTKNTLVDLGTSHVQLIPIKLNLDFVTELDEYDIPEPRSVSYHFFAKSKYAINESFKNDGFSTDEIYVTPGTYDILVHTNDFYPEDGLRYLNFSCVEEFGVELINRSQMTQISPKLNETKNDESSSNDVKSANPRYSVSAYAPDPMYYTIMEDVEINPNDEVWVKLDKGTYRYRMIFPCEEVDVFHESSSIGIYGMKYWLNIYTGDYPRNIDTYQYDSEYMHLSVDTTGEVCGEDCFYFDFYSLGFNPESSTKIYLELSGDGGLGSLLDITAEEDNELQLKYVNMMIDELKNMPKGGESVYKGARLNSYILLKAQSIDPTIEDWYDESFDIIL